MTITDKQAIGIATMLFPDDIFTGHCADGPQCRACLVQEENWKERVSLVKDAVELALSQE